MQAHEGRPQRPGPGAPVSRTPQLDALRAALWVDVGGAQTETAREAIDCLGETSISPLLGLSTHERCFSPFL